MDKVKALMEGVTQDVIAYLVEEDHLPIEKAMDNLYNSEIFLKLSDKETGLYRESPAYVASLLRDELASGRIIQTEI